ncbi:hypothetical protein V7S57_02185 [Caulobacter sp. CCNWLY153]|uniref:hypothetical protein n=1 Tax=unclassified Caulobacter TaxID=2648921 RepID=UPI002FEE92CA
MIAQQVAPSPANSPHTVAIGPMTEARIRAYFERKPIITAKACADLLDLDPKTLRGMTAQGLINCVLTGAKGTTKAYTEADVRDYFTRPRAPVRPQELDKPCPSISRKARASINSTSNTKVVGFTEALARRRSEKPKK